MRFFSAFLLTFLFSFSSFSAEPTTYFLGVGVCPPWKGKEMANDCKNAVNKVKEAFVKKGNISKSNVKLVLDKNATYQGVVDAMLLLGKKVKDEDRVVIFMNVHGGPEATDNNSKYKGREHELFVFWTEEYPFTIESAVEGKQWMTSQDLRKLFDQIKGEKIIIIDACHAAYSQDDFARKDAVVRNPLAKEALIFSVKPNQSAMSLHDKHIALFSDEISNAIIAAKNLDEAFLVAKKQTSKKALEICAAIQNDKTISADVKKEACSMKNPQSPTKDDPYQLLRKFILS